MSPADDASLLEWIDARRAAAELARDGAIGVGLVVPIGILLVVVRLAFAGTKAAWFGPAMTVAGIVFLLGILAAVVLGFMSASRTRAFIDSVAASLETLSPMPLGDGDRVGDLHAARMPEGLTLDHRWGIVRLRATRVAMLMLALITGAGAGVLVVMLMGQGVSSTKGLLGVIGMGFLAVSVPFWMIAFRKPLAVRMRFDGVAGVLHVLALCGVFRTVRFELPYEAMVGVAVDHTEILGSRRVRLVVGDRVLEIARFPAPRTNSRSSSILGKRDADEAHDDLCAFRCRPDDRDLHGRGRPRAAGLMLSVLPEMS